MCQTNAFVVSEKNEELLLENVTSLEVLEKGLRIATLFEGARDFPELAIRKIDFSGGKLLLFRTEEGC
jgi:predicted RNA-binding protein